MQLPEKVYPELEDSKILREAVKEQAFGVVLDMGCGNGAQTREAVLSTKVKSVIGADLNKDAVEYCIKTIDSKKTEFVVSDLFTNLKKKKFDTILFNPPYLPEDKYPHDPAVIGGKKGWETIDRFLKEAVNHLNSEGQILLLFTSKTRKDAVDKLIIKYVLEKEKLIEKKIHDETYYVYKITLSKSLKECIKNKTDNIELLTKGKRGLIYKGIHKGKEAVIKIANPKSYAFGSCENEAKMLRKTNEHKIGPKLYWAEENSVCMEFIEGEIISEWLKNASMKDARKVFKEVLLQCLELDKIGVQKEEMHYPYKHIIVGKNTVLIDFERSRFTIKPHNVTQFCQYIAMNAKKLSVDEKEVKERAREYSADNKSFNKIIELIENT